MPEEEAWLIPLNTFLIDLSHLSIRVNDYWVKLEGGEDEDNLFSPIANDIPYSSMVLHRLFDTLPGYVYHPHTQRVNPFSPRAAAPPLALLLYELPPRHLYAYLQSWNDTEAAYNLPNGMVATFSFSPSAANFVEEHPGPIDCFASGQLCFQFLYKIEHIIDDLSPDLSPGT